MKYFISDTHFGHANILKYDNRPFDDINTHDRVLADNINNALSAGDTLYHLGDVAWTPQAYATWQQRRRNDVNYIMLKGNHDHRLKGTPTSAWHDVLWLPDEKIWLSHYPHLSWPGSFHGAIHLFGHVHGMTKGVGRSLDVSANMINYTPVPLYWVQDRLTGVPSHNV